VAVGVNDKVDGLRRQIDAAVDSIVAGDIIDYYNRKITDFPLAKAVTSCSREALADAVIAAGAVHDARKELLEAVSQPPEQ